MRAGGSVIARPRRVAVLFHEDDRKLSSYAVTHLAEFWRRDGIEVHLCRGIAALVPADLLLVHVNLSVVPDEYLACASRYPVTLNGRVKDIRKSSFSDNLLRPGEAYAGPVIVKSDLNYAGWPERMLRGPAARLRARLWPGRHGFRSQLDYRVYDRVESVPAACFERSDLVVERFLPERDGDLYCVRTYQFLGDRQTTARLWAREPVVCTANHCRVEAVEPHPRVIELRHEMQFDYGKFDYVVRDGEPVLLDVNKTTGAAARSDPALGEERRHRAGGIHSFLDAMPLRSGR